MKGGFVGTKERTRMVVELVPVHLLLLFFITSFVVCGDDTSAVRNTISSLCSLNSGTKFGKCCEEYPIESINLSKRESWSCFANDMKMNDRGDLILLFAFFPLFFSFFFIYFYKYQTGIFHQEG